MEKQNACNQVIYMCEIVGSVLYLSLNLITKKINNKTKLKTFLSKGQRRSIYIQSF